MSLSALLLEDHQPPSPDSAKNSPSPPALVPTEEQPAKKRSVASAESLKDEAIAFSKFLEIEQARLKVEEPNAPRLEIERKLTLKWTRMTARQRISYLHPKSLESRDFEANDSVAPLKPLKPLQNEKGGFSEELVAPTPKRIRRIPIAVRPGSLPAAAAAFCKPKAVVEQEGRIDLPPIEEPRQSVRPPVRDNLKSVASALGLPPGPSTPIVSTPQSRKRSMEQARPRVFVTRGKPTPVIVPVQIQLSQPQFVQPEPPLPRQQEPGGPANAREALDLFYLSLCAPAFPHPDESPLTPHDANYYYDAYLRLGRY